MPQALFADRSLLDITDRNAVMSFVKNNEISTIVNCAAYTAVDRAETEIKEAYLVNAIGAENIALTGCQVIHISTDYVFDGHGYLPYQCDETTSPETIYGKSKKAGEEAVLNLAEQAVVIRTAWLYSSFGNNFVKTIYRLGTEREQLTVVADQIGSPTYTIDLAQAIVKILPQINRENKGIYHFTNEGVCSWYDFATVIIKLANLSTKVIPVSSTEYKTIAKRPFYSVLDKSKIKKVFHLQIPHWMESLELCLKQYL